MDLIKQITPSAIIGRLGQSFRRFPLAMLFTLLLACFLLYVNHGGKVDDKQLFFLTFYPATGAVLAVVLGLLTEDFKSRRAALLVQVVVHAAWLAVSAYLSLFDRFSIPQLLAVAATVVAMVLAVFLICFYRKGQDVQFWNFSIRTAFSLIIAAGIGVVLMLGLFALIESLRLLFGLTIPDKAYADIAVVCMVMLAPALFMNLIPAGEDKRLSHVQEFSRFAQGVVQYLFIPLLVLYLVTLYAYAAKILMQWTLPVGGVSYLVTGSMVLMVLLIYVSYPVQHLEGHRLFKRVTRWMPVVMLPLLALMTVAVGRRLSDYGVTVSRLYLLVFNLWCYAVCLWLIFTRNRRIWMIPASFALILFLISVGPQSIANVTLNRLHGEVREAFASAGFTQLPLKGEQYDAWVHVVDAKTAAAIDSKLDYMEDIYRYDGVKDLIARDVTTGRVTPSGDENRTNAGYEYYSNWKMLTLVDIPDGYRHLSWVEATDATQDDVEGDTITVIVTAPEAGDQTFKASIRALIALDQEKWPDGIPSAPMILDNGETQLMVNHFTLSINGRREVDFLNIDGLLLAK